MTLPQDEEHALDSKTTLETEQKHQSSGAKFIVQTIWINISTCAKVNNYLDQDKLKRSFRDDCREEKKKKRER